MPNLEQSMQELRLLYELERQDRMQRENMLQDIGNVNAAFQDELDHRMSQRVQMWQESIKDKLANLVRYPPHHSRHFEKLKEFYEKHESTYESSVFIMTKFPGEESENDLRLRKVVDAAAKAIRNCDYCPCIASDRQYHAMLWDNVELYLMGCSKGVAIVEDRYKPELNPNVALETGWMRGMGKDVLFLMEDGFKHNRADWDGFLRESFSWENPDASIDHAIKRWLTKS